MQSPFIVKSASKKGTAILFIHINKKIVAGISSSSQPFDEKSISKYKYSTRIWVWRHANNPVCRVSARGVNHAYCLHWSTDPPPHIIITPTPEEEGEVTTNRNHLVREANWVYSTIRYDQRTGCYMTCLVSRPVYRRGKRMPGSAKSTSVKKAYIVFWPTEQCQRNFHAQIF